MEVHKTVAMGETFTCPDEKLSATSAMHSIESTPTTEPYGVYFRIDRTITSSPEKTRHDNDSDDSDDSDDNDSDDNDNDDSDNDEPEEKWDEQREAERWLPKAIALCKHLWPSAEYDSESVKYITCGSYNIVFGISMTLDGEPVEYVLRISTEEDNVARSAAIFEHMAKFPGLKVPKLIKWDDTQDNPLGNAYTILSRVPGKSLDQVLKDITHEQKLLLAKELAKLYHELESITSPVAGVFSLRKNGPLGGEISDRIFIEPFGAGTVEFIEEKIDWNVEDNGYLPLDRVRHDPPGLSVTEIISVIFKRRLYGIEYQDPPADYLYWFLDRCEDTILAMIKLELLRPLDDTICLHHTDLFPRNIMVDFTPDIVITGTLDWDDAEFVPRFGGRIPPRWLWRTEPDSECDSWRFDLEPLDPKDNEPDSPENAEVKRVFEDAMGENWVSEATAAVCPYARRLLTFSRRSLYFDEEIKDVIKWIDQWESIYGAPSDVDEDSDTESIDDDTASSDGGEDSDDGNASEEKQESPITDASSIPESKEVYICFKTINTDVDDCIENETVVPTQKDDRDAVATGESTKTPEHHPEIIMNRPWCPTARRIICK
ncbi:hypothetical protein F5Y04DRAFT_286769 [Hypomontagnella monticulosa]|nr:hypothetical protein F5Y04DRAFT_286769 [Hypomontagnella monticulosa]